MRSKHHDRSVAYRVATHIWNEEFSTMTTDRAKRRPRRIAADEAHAWARNLRLGNHHAKSVLRSLTLYVDGDGFCFVGIEQLADDCELSPDTVRRRLVWLEEIGTIARRSQWIDGSGVRNGEGRGQAHQRPDPAFGRCRPG